MSALDILHHDEGLSVGFADFVNRADVRVIQRRGVLRFAHQPCSSAIVRGEVLYQLYRDGAAQTRVAGAIHLSHAAGANQADDLVGTETNTGGQAHSGESAASLIPRPLSPGTHTIRWIASGCSAGHSQDITYHLTVVGGGPNH
jgi:hypothetical protein